MTQPLTPAELAELAQLGTAIELGNYTVQTKDRFRALFQRAVEHELSKPERQARMAAAARRRMAHHGSP